MKLRNKKWSEEYFFKARNELLNNYNIKNTEYCLKNLSDNKNCAKKLMAAKQECITLVQLGIAHIPEQKIEFLKYLQDKGKPDLILMDMYDSMVQNKNNIFNLNCFIEQFKEMYCSIELPLQASYSTSKCRLLTEMIYSCGFTSSLGGAISCNLSYLKHVSIEKSILDWQYCDRLAGFYEEQGIYINRETFGLVNYNNLIPPSISNAISIIEGLLAAEQGVKNITVGVRQGGNLIQDIAAIKALEEQIDDYMKDYGYEDVCITTALHQCILGSFEDDGKTFGVLSVGIVTAILAGATKVVIKTSDLDKKINSSIVSAAKMPVNILNGQRLAMSKELETEIVIIKAEVKCILDKILELGKGDLAVGIVNAFKDGIMNISFSPNELGKTEMTSARDNTGAIRYMEFGNIPFTQELKNFNKRKIENKNIKE